MAEPHSTRNHDVHNTASGAASIKGKIVGAVVVVWLIIGIVAAVNKKSAPSPARFETPKSRSPSESGDIVYVAYEDVGVTEDSWEALMPDEHRRELRDLERQGYRIVSSDFQQLADNRAYISIKLKR